MITVFVVCYMWVMLAALAFLTYRQDPALLPRVMLLGCFVAVPLGLISGIVLWLLALHLLPGWLAVLSVWLPYAVFAWWTGDAKTIETMIIAEALLAAVIWPIALAGLLVGLILEVVAVVVALAILQATDLSIRVAGASITARVRTLIAMAKALGL
jgi:hypothetical protein